MAIGKSGRVIIELTPKEKAVMHEAIRKKGLTMKSWFLAKAKDDFPELAKINEEQK